MGHGTEGELSFALRHAYLSLFYCVILLTNDVLQFCSKMSFTTRKLRHKVLTNLDSDLVLIVALSVLGDSVVFGPFAVIVLRLELQNVADHVLSLKRITKSIELQ